MAILTKDATSTSRFQERMHERAAFWLARLRSDSCSDSDLQEFALWLSASPEHQSAMDGMLALWEDLAVLEHMPQSLPEQPQLPQTAVSQERRQWLGFGLAAAACTLFAVLLVPGFNSQVSTEIYQTDLGETKSVHLADGSVVTLNTSSKISVELDSESRHVVLERGEAFFEITRDPQQRPFTVDAGNAEVRVMGTAFNIHRLSTHSDITVTEGVVRVTEKGNAANRAAVSELLYANQSIRSESSGLAPAQTAESTVSTAWREGKIIAQSMALSELVQEISRYHQLKIMIAEPGLAQTKVSGVFNLNQPDSILEALEHSIGINAMVLEDQTVLLIKTTL